MFGACACACMICVNWPKGLLKIERAQTLRSGGYATSKLVRMCISQKGWVGVDHIYDERVCIYIKRIFANCTCIVL